MVSRLKFGQKHGADNDTADGQRTSRAPRRAPTLPKPHPSVCRTVHLPACAPPPAPSRILLGPLTVQFPSKVTHQLTSPHLTHLHRPSHPHSSYQLCCVFIQTTTTSCVRGTLFRWNGTHYHPQTSSVSSNRLTPFSPVPAQKPQTRLSLSRSMLPFHTRVQSWGNRCFPFPSHGW